MDIRTTASLNEDERQLEGGWGEFQLLERIGRGSCADAWLALRTGSARFAKLVVLKVLRDGVVPEQAQDTLEREALALSRMNHPNVVQVLDVVEQHQRRALVMEYIEGKPLTQLGWPPSAPLTLSVGLRLLHDILLGLDHVHNARDHDGSPLCIVHGDVSPNNVLLTYTGQAKLIDFGLAQHRGAADTAGGTLRYMAPERLLGDSLTPAADIYGLGVMMWELLAQRPLWEGLDRERVQAASLAGLVQAPLSSSSAMTTPAAGKDALDPWLPMLERACMKALAYFPKDRHTSSADFARELSAAPLASHGETQAFLEHFHGADREARRMQIASRIAQLRGSEGGGIESPAPSSRSPVVASAAIRPRTTARRSRWYSAGAALALLSLGAYAVSTLSTPNTPRSASRASPEASAPSPPANEGSASAGPFLPGFAAHSLENSQATIAPSLLSSERAPRPLATSGQFSDLGSNDVLSSNLTSDDAAARQTAPGAQPRPAPQPDRLRARPAPSHAQIRPAQAAELQTRQPTPAANSTDCSPRFVYNNGIKRFKAACFR